MFFVREDLVQVGVGEDGDTVLASAFYVVREERDGRRWAHEASFLNREARYDSEEGLTYWALVPGAEARAQRLLARVVAHVAAGGELDAARWVEIDPAYGSAAYQAADAAGYWAARERQEARDAGEAVPFDQAFDVHFA